MHGNATSEIYMYCNLKCYFFTQSTFFIIQTEQKTSMHELRSISRDLGPSEGTVNFWFIFLNSSNQTRSMKKETRLADSKYSTYLGSSSQWYSSGPRRGQRSPSPVKIIHTKNGHRRQPHRFRASWFTLTQPLDRLLRYKKWLLVFRRKSSVKERMMLEWGKVVPKFDV